MGTEQEVRPGQHGIKRTHSFLTDDLNMFQQDRQMLQVANKIIVTANMDTGACFIVKKGAEVVYNAGKMIKRQGLTGLEEKMKALDPEQNEVYKYSWNRNRQIKLN